MTSLRASGRSRPNNSKGATDRSNAKAIPVDEDDVEEETRVAVKKRFPFLELPFELRLRIYEEVLLLRQTIDLNPLNFFNIAPRLSLFLTCRQIHEEAYPVFYGQDFYLYPTHGRFFHTKKPLVTRLSTRYRGAIPTLSWRIGPGWGSPPKSQNTNPSLGLADCKSLKTLKIFIECDPSDTVFAGFRGPGATEDTYKYFCINLLLGIFEQVPTLRVVEIDAYPSVKRDSPIVLGLLRHIKRAGKTLTWGPLREWDEEKDEPGLVGLENALASMNISGSARMIETPA